MFRPGRTTALTVFLLVSLRIAIGWQLFYEGVWKIETQRTPTPWTAAGYLKNSSGPMRGTFRAMTGDPDDLDWLDVDKMANKWDAWQQRFASHYQLTDAQKAKLNSILNGPKEFQSDHLAALPEGVDLSKVGVISYSKRPSKSQPERTVLVVDGKRHLDGREYTRLLNMAPEAAVAEDTPEDVQAFREQLEKVYLRSSRLSYKERLQASVRGNPDVAGITNKEGESQQMGNLEKYQHMLADYEKALANAKQDFQHDHLQKLWGDIQKEKSSLVGPIRALDADLQKDAQALLSLEQLNRGKSPAAWSPQRTADWLTIAGLTCLGLLLIAGLFTRFSAFMAAIMLFSFYMAMPPFPGYPEAPGPEHSLIVNKNLVEVLALLAIAALPTGSWFGLDGLLTKLLFGRRRSGDND
ncbi:MAG: hypothetical protein CL681_13630 [Blastopirellula sp.]|nr:hypothetical protein [Blastopirellula sp.]